MERLTDSHQLPSVTLFSWVLGPPTKGQETTLAAIGIPNKMGHQDHGAEPTHSVTWPQVGHLLACQELPQ